MNVDQTVQHFFSAYRPRAARKGSVLLLPGDVVNEVIYLESGSVGQFAITDTGNKIMINLYKPGAFLPMLSVLDGTPNQYYFESASADTVIRLAPAAEVVRFIQSNPDVLFDLLRRMYRGLDGILQRMIQHMSGSAESRLKIELEILAQRFGTVQSNGLYELCITDQELAAQTGMARETVSRAMTSLRKQQIVERVHKGLNIDLDKLRNAA